jgi:DNA polymerase-3 subunit alpha
LVADEPILIHGVLDRGEKGIKIKATRVDSLPSPKGPAIIRVTIGLSAMNTTRNDLLQLKEILLRHKGSCSVQLKLSLPQEQLGNPNTIALDQSLRVNPTEALIAELEAAYGKGAVVLQYEEKP